MFLGNYHLQDEDDRALAEEIVKFLGYKKEEKVKKYK